MTSTRMRTGLPLWGFLLLPLFGAWASKAQPAEVVLAFDEGVRQYEEQQFAAALESFQAAESSGLESAALSYNIGNTYFRLNQLGRAILYYERARRLEPNDPLILHSLRVARERTVDRFSRVPDPVWTTAWNGLVAVMKPDGLFATGLLLFLFGVGLATQRIWSGDHDDWNRRGMVLGFGAGTLLLAAGLYASKQMVSRHHAVVLDTSTPVHAAPEEGASTIVMVHEGLLLESLDVTDEWVHVRLPNGVTGWVESGSIEAL